MSPTAEQLRSARAQANLDSLPSGSEMATALLASGVEQVQKARRDSPGLAHTLTRLDGPLASDLEPAFARVQKALARETGALTDILLALSDRLDALETAYRR